VPELEFDFASTRISSFGWLSVPVASASVTTLPLAGVGTTSTEAAAAPLMAPAVMKQNGEPVKVAVTLLAALAFATFWPT
jgi:hypothetical protein